MLGSSPAGGSRERGDGGDGDAVPDWGPDGLLGALTIRRAEPGPAGGARGGPIPQPVVKDEVEAGGGDATCAFAVLSRPAAGGGLAL
eukprot:353924-Chlamydomonas_euryale.AAC.7